MNNYIYTFYIIIFFLTYLILMVPNIIIKDYSFVGYICNQSKYHDHFMHVLNFIYFYDNKLSHTHTHTHI